MGEEDVYSQGRNRKDARSKRGANTRKQLHNNIKLTETMHCVVQNNPLLPPGNPGRFGAYSYPGQAAIDCGHVLLSISIMIT